MAAINAINKQHDALVDDPEIKAACKSAYAAGEPIPEGYCYSPGTGVVTRMDARGILPLALVELIANRKRYADEAKKHPPGTPAFTDAIWPILWFMPPRNTSLRSPLSSTFGTRKSEMPLTPGGAPARCNPVSAPTECTAGDVESLP